MFYIVKRKGKQMRPMFVFLSAKVFDNVTESTYIGASLIELLHTATLVHDDVVDDANIRRGFFSINALWKNKIAVLVGDFLLSRGLLLAVEKEEFQLLKIVSNAVQSMSEGELLQIEKARKLDIDEPTYFEIIRQKTATLIAACCACGACSAKQEEDIINKFHLLGETIGIAFQIKDDLFDYMQNPIIGKPSGIDIREQKMTLPLIYALNHAEKEKKNEIINIIKNHSKNTTKVAEVIDFVKQSGGLNYAQMKMQEYHQKAHQILDDLPNNEAKASLKQMVDFVIERRK